jgi:hypothetical protein
MPRKTTAHEQLDQLRQNAAAERVRHRDLQAGMEAAKAEVEQASRAITDGYAAEDQRAVAQARKTETEAVANVRELQHRVDGAALRVERAQQELAAFQREHARDLLAEREQPARTIAAQLTASVHETIRLAKSYITEREAQDRLVAAVPDATVRTDGPAASHPWERQLKDLERAVSEVSELPPPLPSWWGVDHRRTENAKARRLQLQRRKKKTADEAAELDKINRELGVSAPRGGVI